MLKRIIATVLAGVMVLSIAACGSTEEAATSTTEVSVASATASQSAEATPAVETKKLEDAEGNVVMWNWENQDQLKAYLADFNTRFPKVKVESVPVASTDYVQKIQTAVSAKTDLPDVIRGEMGFRGTLYSMDILDDLSNAPYNFDKTKIPEQAWPLVMNDKQQVLGALTQFNPSGIAYRRSLVKELFGTDDPAAIAEKFKTWDDVIAAFKDAKIAGKKVYAFRSVRDIFHIVDGYNPTNPIQDGVVKFDEVYLPTFQLIEKMWKAGVLNKYDFWTPAWNASFAKKDDVFTAAAPWFLKYVVEPNDPKGTGDWAVTAAPGGMFNWGGTALSVAKDSKVKEAAWAYIYDQILNEKGVKNAFETGMNITPVKEFIDKPGFYSRVEPYWGNQDVGKFFMDNIGAVKVKALGKYDGYLEANFVLGLQKIKEGKTAEEAVAAMVADIKKNVPELK
ncbi:MAG: ABC transporter substrate-binding protein [Ruminiclostridium sp.]